VLPPQQPHKPSCGEDATNKHSEAIEAVADLFASRAALGDSKYYGREDSKQHGSGEVREREVHGFFPIAM